MGPRGVGGTLVEEIGVGPVRPRGWRGVEDLHALPSGAEHLVPVLERAMASEFSRRYFTAGELSKALVKANGT